MQDRIDILLPTYFGDKYLVDQLESLFAQTYQNFRLLIRDDGSGDNTIDIINQYKKKYPDKIFLIPNDGTTENVIHSFSTLAEYADAQYIMFCDQDDVWFPDKISKTLAKMKQMESQYGPATPLLAFTDMQVVDKQLNILDKSQWHYLNRNPIEGMKLNRLCMEPIAWGCAMMFNKPLLELAFPLPPNCFVHDIWVSLVAATMGKMDFVNEATMYYRVHDYNLCSFDRYHVPSIIGEFSRNKENYNSLIARRTLQAFVLYRRYSEILSDENKEILQQYITVRNHSFLKEFFLRIKNKFLFQGFWRNILLFVMLLRIGRLPKKYQLKV